MAQRFTLFKASTKDREDKKEAYLRRHKICRRCDYHKHATTNVHP
jgi:hypothetical protein